QDIEIAGGHINLKCSSQSQAGHFKWSEAGYILASKVYFTRSWRVVSRDAVKQRRFAGAIRADQAQHLTFGNFEGNVPIGSQPTESHAEILNSEQGHQFLRPALNRVIIPHMPLGSNAAISIMIDE